MKLVIGTKLDVWSEDESEYLGVGYVMGYECITTLGETIRLKQDTPLIRLSSGETVRGSECEYDVILG